MRLCAHFFMTKSQSKNSTRQAKKGGTPNKGTLLSHLQNFSLESIDYLVDTMRTSRNENLRFAAARAILDKTVPDLKATEVTGQDNSPILIKIVSEK